MWLRKSPTILPPLTWTISSLPAGASARQIINHQQTATKLKLPWTILLLRWTPLLLTMILQKENKSLFPLLSNVAREI